MPAPKFNEYWKNRKKHGRDKIFSDPDEIIELAQQYIEYCDNNPIEVEEMIKGGNLAGEIRKVKRPRIPHEQGFSVFLGIDSKTFWNYKNDEKYKDFFQTFYYVCDIFDSQLKENATTGQANPAISAMLLGLKQKQEISGNTDLNLTVNLSKDEARKLSEDLEHEI